MYTVEAIVLRRYDYQPGKAVLTVFSRDFGRFDCFYTPSKLSPKVDTGTWFRGSITTKQGKNSLGTITSFSFVSTQDWDYITYDFFLWFVMMSYKLLPEGNTYIYLYDDLKILFLSHESVIETHTRLAFLTLRLLVHFGIHRIEENTSLSELVEKIRHAKYEDMQTDLSGFDLSLLRGYAQNCYDTFLSQA